MDPRRVPPTRNFQDRGQPAVEDIYGEDWQRRNPMDFVAPRVPSPILRGGTDPRDFVPNWDFEALRRSLHPHLSTQGPEPMNPFSMPSDAQLKGMLRKDEPIAIPQGVPPTQPISLPPEAFRDPSQFVTPIAPSQPPQISTTPSSQEIDIPEIRNQALRLPNAIQTGVPGIEIRPGNKMPIRGRYRF